MIKKCPVCSHVGELTWRDGKYYCAMCSSEVSETEPTVQAYADTPVANIACPICRNKDNNLFDGTKYRCALCGTSFDLQRKQEIEQKFSVDYSYGARKIEELEKKKDRTLITACVLVIFFWPASIYFFYKFAQIKKELDALKH